MLDEFGAYPAVIQRELDRYLPFLATTRILIAAVRAGVGRETAHEVIKEHAVAVALAMRERGAEPDLLDRLAADPAAAAGPGGAGRRAGRQAGVHRGGRAIRSTGWSPRSTTWSAAIPRPPSTRRARSCDAVGAEPCTRSTSPIWTTSPTVSRTTCSRCTAARRRCTGTSPPSNTPDGEGFWSVATHAETLAVLRDPETYSSVTGGDRPFGGTLLQDLSDRRSGAEHDGRPAALRRSAGWSARG